MFDQMYELNLKYYKELTMYIPVSYTHLDVYKRQSLHHVPHRGGGAGEDHHPAAEAEPLYCEQQFLSAERGVRRVRGRCV